MAKIGKVISYLLLVVYIGYFASTNFFVHSHHFQNRTVVHSHPFANRSHGHTGNEIQLIDLLQEITSTEGVSLPSVSCPEIECFVIEAETQEQSPVLADVQHLQRRGPPCLA